MITINGILMATQNEFSAHAGNANMHVTAQEKEKWNSGGQGSKGDKGDPGPQGPQGPKEIPASRAQPVHKAPKGTRETKVTLVPKVRRVPACLRAASCGSVAAQPRTAGWNATEQPSKSANTSNYLRQSAPLTAATA